MVRESTMQRGTFQADLSSQYDPVAVYYEDADMVEYIREDVPSVSQRIDAFLTLELKMDSREPIGFKLKGFKNFYLRHLKDDIPTADNRDHFLALVKVIEKAIHVLGDKAFEKDRKAAYEQAYKIAEEDGAELHELPRAA
jgi:hypothetical protein